MEDKKKPKVIDVDAKTGMVTFSLFLDAEAAIKYSAKVGKPLDCLVRYDVILEPLKTIKVPQSKLKKAAAKKVTKKKTAKKTSKKTSKKVAKKKVAKKATKRKEKK
jgi:hypothetical protein